MSKLRKFASIVLLVLNLASAVLEIMSQFIA